jgi:hypothetical protein
VTDGKQHRVALLPPVASSSIPFGSAPHMSPSSSPLSFQSNLGTPTPSAPPSAPPSPSAYSTGPRSTSDALLRLESASIRDDLWVTFGDDNQAEGSSMFWDEGADAGTGERKGRAMSPTEELLALKYAESATCTGRDTQSSRDSRGTSPEAGPSPLRPALTPPLSFLPISSAAMPLSSETGPSGARGARSAQSESGGSSPGVAPRRRSLIATLGQSKAQRAAADLASEQASRGSSSTPRSSSPASRPPSHRSSSPSSPGGVRSPKSCRSSVTSLAPESSGVGEDGWGHAPGRVQGEAGEKLAAWQRALVARGLSSPSELREADRGSVEDSKSWDECSRTAALEQEVARLSERCAAKSRELAALASRAEGLQSQLREERRRAKNRVWKSKEEQGLKLSAAFGAEQEIHAEVRPLP